MKRWLAVLLCVTMLVSFCGCNKEETGDTTTTEQTTPETTAASVVSVGVCLPNQTEQRWIQEGAALKKALEAKNFQVLLQDGQNDATLQAEQIGKLTEEKVQCLVVAAVDSAALSQSVALAKNAGIPVIAYDRLLVNTDGVVGYVGFDYLSLGLDAARKIIMVKGLETAKAGKKSCTVEFLMGSYENHSNMLYYQGLMQGLQSYLDSGVLVCESKRTLFEDVCVKNAEPNTAQSLWKGLLSNYDKETWPDVLVAGNDVLADGCAAALKAAGCPLENWPLIVGQTATASEVSRVASGKQLLTVHYDREALVQAGADAVEAVLAGKPVGEKTVANGAIAVPGAMLLPETVTFENYQALLIDTGIFAQEDLTIEQENPDA